MTEEEDSSATKPATSLLYRDCSIDMQNDLCTRSVGAEEAGLVFEDRGYVMTKRTHPR